MMQTFVLRVRRSSAAEDETDEREAATATDEVEVCRMKLPAFLRLDKSLFGCDQKFTPTPDLRLFPAKSNKIRVVPIPSAKFFRRQKF